MNPRRIRVATPRRDRGKHPDFVKVERRNLPAGERTVYEGIPATTVARALLDCRGAIMDERLIEAAREAARTGLLRRRDAQRVLSDLDRHWLTVPFELGRDEVGSTEEVQTRLAQDILDLFSAIGLPEPQPLPVLAVEHQIAQKLHACTSVNPKTGANERAHDLVDLQILEQEERIDMTAVDAVATRLFDARRGTPWPPTVRAYEGWDTVYASAADGLDVLEDVHAAVEWANDFIARAIRARAA